MNTQKNNFSIITGSHGQDARILAEILNKNGVNVLALTRKKNQPDFENITFLETNYSEKDILKILDRYSVDRIFNFAGQSHVSKSWVYIDETFKSHTEITTNFLKNISKDKYRNIKMINASSSEIFYPDNNNQINENSKIQPINPYGAAKASSHHLIEMFRERYDLNINNLFLFPHESIYRPDNFAMKKIISTLSKISKGSNEKLELGNIDVYRDWGYAKEFCEIIELISKSESKEDYCICTSHILSLKEALEICLDYYNLDFAETVIFVENLYRYKEHEFVLGDNSKVSNEFSWKPKFHGKKLVLKLIEDFESMLDKQI
jgi:GDPmannose 4,6-dehydratase